MMEILTREQYDRFHADGYLKFSRVISDEQVERMRAALDRVIAEELERDGDDGEADGGVHGIQGRHRDPRYQPPGCDLSEDLHPSAAPRGAGEPVSLSQAVRTWDADRAVPVELKAGECMFHHCLNYHMTPEN